MCKSHHTTKFSSSMIDIAQNTTSKSVMLIYSSLADSLGLGKIRSPLSIKGCSSAFANSFTPEFEVSK